MRNLLNISLLSLCFCLILTGVGHAKLHLSLYATGGVHDFAVEQNLESDPLTGFKVSLDFEGGKEAHDFSLEGTFNQFSATNLNDDSPVDATMARVDVIYPLVQKTKWRPFLSVGIGRLLFEGEDNKPQDEDIVAYGAGLKYLLTEYLTLRAEGRHELIFNRENGNIDNYEYTASVGYTFGKRKPSKKKPKPKVEPKPEPKPEPKKPSDDDDQDGVKNPVDRCPGTPLGIKVDSTGCAEQTPGRPESFIEENVPAEEPQPVPVKKSVVATAKSVEAPVAKETTTLQKEVVREEPKPVIEQEETPPAFVLPKLPTVIAIPTLPEETQTVAAEAPQLTEPSQAPAAGVGSAVTTTLKTIAAIPALPVAAVIAAADALINTGEPPSVQTENMLPEPSEIAGTALNQTKAAAPEKSATAPTIAAESTVIKSVAQQPVLAKPPVTIGSEPFASAEVTTPAMEDAQNSAALPAKEQLPELLPVPAVAVENPSSAVTHAPEVKSVEKAVATPKIIANAAIPKQEVITEVVVPETPLPTEPPQVPAANAGSSNTNTLATIAAADATTPAIADGQDSAALPTTEQLPEPLPVATIAAAPESPSTLKTSQVAVEKPTSTINPVPETHQPAAPATIPPVVAVSRDITTTQAKSVPGKTEVTETEIEPQSAVSSPSLAAETTAAEKPVVQKKTAATPLKAQQSVAAEAPQITELSQAPASGVGSAVTTTLKTIAAIPALPVAAVVAAADALINTGEPPSAQTENMLPEPSETAGDELTQNKAAVPEKSATTPTIAAESTATKSVAQKPVLAGPSVAIGSEPLATADATTPAIADGQDSAALPTTEQLPEPLPVATVAVENPASAVMSALEVKSVEKSEEASQIIASTAIPKQEVITEVVVPETPQSIEPPQVPAAGAGSADTNTLKTVAATPALPVATVVATAGAAPSQARADVPKKLETAPAISAESTAIKSVAQKPVLAGPPVAIGSEPLATADTTTPAIADGQDSAALPTTEQLPEPLPIATVAVVTEPPAAVEVPKGPSNIVVEAESPTEEASAEAIAQEASLPVDPAAILPVTVASPSITPEKTPTDKGEVQVAEIEKATPSADSVPEPIAEAQLATVPTEPATQPSAEATPLEIPQCSGLPPHAILMLGKSGSELLHVSVDEVKNKPEPYRADANIAKKSHVPTASFDFDVWQLTDKAKQVLTLLVNQLERSGLDYKLRVEGHTDSVGSEAYNYNLSLLRANAVATFLENEKGIAPSKLAIAGCGEWKPLASNETDEGRTLNRRFELVILPGDSQ